MEVFFTYVEICWQICICWCTLTAHIRDCRWIYINVRFQNTLVWTVHQIALLSCLSEIAKHSSRHFVWMDPHIIRNVPGTACILIHKINWDSKSNRTSYPVTDQLFQNNLIHWYQSQMTKYNVWTFSRLLNKYQLILSIIYCKYRVRFSRERCYWAQLFFHERLTSIFLKTSNRDLITVHYIKW